MSENSEPAFPRDHRYGGHNGITKREYFAAKAMQAFLSGHIAHHRHQSHWPYDQMASESLDVADAILKAIGQS